MPEQSARRYSSDLTDAQWQLIKPFFEGQTFREHHPREIVNAIFYHNKAGWQWRMLPQGEEAGFPPWQTVYYHLRRPAFHQPATLTAVALLTADRHKSGG